LFSSLWKTLPSLGRLVRRHPALAVALVALVASAGYVLGRRQYGQYHLAAARRALEQSHLEDAREHLAICRKVWPRDGGVTLLAARTARRCGDLAEARSLLARCEELGGATDEVALEGALLAAQAGELTAQVEAALWERLKQGDPEAPLILEALTLGYLVTYRLGHALDCAERLLARRPDDARALLWRGWVREGMHEPETALKDYRLALGKDPGFDTARLHLAELLMPRRPREAAAHFERLRREKPADPEVFLGLARCRRLLGQTAKARRLLDGVLRQKPRWPGALRERGRVALADRRPAEAETWLRRALAADPHDPEACSSLARCLSLLGRKDEAARFEARSRRIRADFERLWEIGQKIGRSPRDVELRFRAGSICVCNGQGREAERWFRGALQIDPTHRPTLRALAALYDRAGQPDLAARHRRLAEK
jgi:tetratricopeptide (TPR) repeat protein